MAETSTDDRSISRIEDLNLALASGALADIRLLLFTLHPGEIAHLLESLPPAQRRFTWQAILEEERGEVLTHLSEEVRNGLIRDMEDQELIEATANLEVDDLADLFHDLPEAVTEEILTAMGVQDRHRFEAVLSYPEDTAGGLLNTDTVTVRADVTLEVVFRYLRRQSHLPAMTDSLIVVNRDDKLMGILPLGSLLTNDPKCRVREIMDSVSHAVLASTPDVEVAQQFELHDLVSVPVVDEGNNLLGRITIDDVVDVIREEADEDLMRLAGLNEEEDMFAPVIPSASRRAVWLGINLMTALLASWVIGLFEATLDQIVALAVLMPIVASMGGIAGSQTLTLVIRGIALGQLAQSNTRWLMFKEIAVGALNGLLWAMVVALVAYFWFGSKDIGLIIAAAMIINLIVANFSGVMLPIFLQRMGVDPALAGSVLLTTITDVIGFMVFLGLATWWLL